MRKLYAVVPVKLFAHTKRRLMRLLSGSEREALACAMLEDVLSALTHAAAIEGILVVTDDTKAAAVAHCLGATVLADTENTGTTAAVTKAARHLACMGRGGMLVIPADVPAITPADIDAIVAAHCAAPAVTLVRAGSDGGTNALACSPPDAIPFCFGDDSFRRHLAASKACGIEPQVIELERVARDIDRPDDVTVFLEHPSTTRSYTCLTASGIRGRLKSESLSS